VFEFYVSFYLQCPCVLLPGLPESEYSGDRSTWWPHLHPRRHPGVGGHWSVRFIYCGGVL